MKFFLALSLLLLLPLNGVSKECISNGCGTDGTRWFIPNSPAGVSFMSACNQHDRCYSSCDGPRFGVMLVACRDPALSRDGKRCCDQEFLVDMLNLCSEAKIRDRVFCDNCSAIYFGGVNRFGNSSFKGKSLPVWLIEDGPTSTEALNSMRAELRALAVGMGDDARRATVIFSLAEGGIITAEVEETPRYYAGVPPIVLPGTANRTSRDNSRLLYGPRIDISGISQSTELNIRLRLGAGAVTSIPKHAN